MEVVTAQDRVVAILHEARDASEVRRALIDVREWLSLGFTMKETPVLTAVFGCEGELKRGDRAKVGWALAEHCDRVVLTSNDPRSEPPMQIIEDVLDAIRGRATGLDVMCGELSDGLAVTEVHVVADRAEAIKLGATSAMRPRLVSKTGSVQEQGSIGVVMVFGSSWKDYQEATDASGSVKRWLCNDKRIMREAIEVADKINEAYIDELDNPTAAWIERDEIDLRRTPWAVNRVVAATERQGKTSHVLPGRSLHWSYKTRVTTSGKLQVCV